MRTDRQLMLVAIIALMVVLYGCNQSKETKIAPTQEINKEQKPKDNRTTEQRATDRIRSMKIKSQTQWEYPYRFGKPSDRGYKEYYIRYDTLGRPQYAIMFKDVVSVIKYVYRYDNKGLLIRTENYNPVEGFCVSSFNNHNKVDSIGKVIEISVIQEGSGGVLKIHLTYDPDNNPMEEAVYNWRGELDHKNSYSYDVNRNMTESIGLVRERRIFCRSTYNYDNHGLLLQRTDYTDDGEPEILVQYNYEY